MNRQQFQHYLKNVLSERKSHQCDQAISTNKVPVISFVEEARNYHFNVLLKVLQCSPLPFV